MRAPSSLRRKRNKPRRRLPVNCRRLTTTEFEAMGEPGSRELSCSFSLRRLTRRFGCGDADEFKQAFEAAMIDRQLDFFRSAYKTWYKERLI